ncbi:hypothetical protein HCM100_15000 [Helicobacter pylori]
MRVFVCFLGTFLSNGLARFGYVVLIPLLILSGNLTPNQSFQLGIAILIGYIFGSLSIKFLNRFIPLESIAKISFFLIALSFLPVILKIFLSFGFGLGVLSLAWLVVL